jgi:spore maturation protein CgeB
LGGKLKVLLIHPIDSSMGEWEKSLVRTFKYLGDDVESFDYRTVINNKYMNFITRKAGLYEYFLYDVLIKKIYEFNPDFIFVSKGELVSPRILKKINSMNIPLVNWIGDGMWEFDLIKKIAPFYNHFFTFDTETINQLSLIGIKNGVYLPFGFDTLLNREFDADDNGYYISDVAFVGTPTAERLVLLSYMSKLNINIKIWGPKSWEKTDYSSFYMGKPIFGNEMYYAYSQAKLVINVHYGFGIDVIPKYNGINHRVFEAFGVGTYCLSNYQNDMNHTFSSELITYNNYEEMIELIPSLIYQNNTRAMQEEIINQHSLISRIRYMKEVVMVGSNK